MSLLTVAGLGLNSKLTFQLPFVEGSPAKQAFDITATEFGDEETTIVMLRGPRPEVEAQGRRLVNRLSSMTGVLVISPWTSGKVIGGLRPKPGVAALLVNLKPGSGEDVHDALAAIRQRVAKVVRQPVDVSIAGPPALVDSYKDAAERATRVGELVAIPVLLIVLLLIFRSVFAAAIPLIVGGTVVAAARGVMDLSLGLVNLQLIALGVVGMVGLALGVDYSLLVISRFREEMRTRNDVAGAVETTMISTSRAVIPAGSGLILAMLATSLVVPSPEAVSVGFVVILVALLSMLSSLLVVPAVLTLLGTNLDRWSLPIRQSGHSAVSRLSESLSRRPIALAAVMLILLACSALAFTLNSEVATSALLPTGDPGRQEYEEVGNELGPGWTAPVEVIMHDHEGPVTTPSRLRALADFQRRVERDPAVSTMAGLGPIEHRTRHLGGLEQSLFSQERRMARLAKGLAQATHSSAAASAELAKAAGAASKLGTAGKGAGKLAGGLNVASGGSRELADGLQRAGSGSSKLASGTAKASSGSKRLADGLDRAMQEADDSSGNSQLLDSALQDGEEKLAGLHSPVRATAQQIAIVRKALIEMTAGRKDPRYGTALQAAEAASEDLSGVDANTGETLDPAFDGVDTGIAQAENQFDLSQYLARRMEKGQSAAQAGLRKLAHSSRRLDHGLRRLATGSRKFSVQTSRLADGGEKLPPGLQRLAHGAQRLAHGLGEAAEGTSGIGQGEGGTQIDQLTGSLRKAQAEVESQGSPQSGGSQGSRLHDQSPGLFRSGYFYLASLDGSKPTRQRQAAFLVNVDRGGSTARMLIIPRSAPNSPQARRLRDHVQRDAEALETSTGAKVLVGGFATGQTDLNSYYRGKSPLIRLVLVIVSMLIVLLVLRSLAMALIAGVINLIIVAASLGVLALLFNNSLLGGPGYVDTLVVPATIMLLFGLGIDYEVFVYARMREEYVRTGSPSAAISNGIDHTAHVVTGAAVIMIGVFVAFSLSSFMTFRQFGVAQAIGVFIDAFIIRLIVSPAIMRALGRWAWWMPRWLDRLIPGQPTRPPGVDPDSQ